MSVGLARRCPTRPRALSIGRCPPHRYEKAGVVYPFCVEGVPTGGHGGGLAEYRGMQVYLCPGCGGQSPTRGRCTTCRRSDHRAQALEPERRARNRQAWRDARALTKRRDNYQCVECGRRDELEVHHVVSLRNGGDEYNLDNLVTLCRTHHRFFEKTAKHPRPSFSRNKQRARNGSTMRKDRCSVVFFGNTVLTGEHGDRSQVLGC